MAQCDKDYVHTQRSYKHLMPMSYLIFPQKPSEDTHTQVLDLASRGSLDTPYSTHSMPRVVRVHGDTCNFQPVHAQPQARDMTHDGGRPFPFWDPACGSRQRCSTAIPLRGPLCGAACIHTDTSDPGVGGFKLLVTVKSSVRPSRGMATEIFREYSSVYIDPPPPAFV